MQLDKYDKVYFLGIGGIGMSAVARWFMINNLQVAGYDANVTSLTNQLVKEGISIHFEDDVDAIPKTYAKDDTLVVYTPAIPTHHRELNHLKKCGYTILKRAEVLGEIVQGHNVIAVAGSHGKTTASSMITHILKSAKMNMAAFLGGITTNYNTNLVIEGVYCDTMTMVVEADEYDRSFMTLSPDTAVVTSIDSDHLDIYGNYEEVKASFLDFVCKIKSGGTLFVHNDAPVECQHLCTYTYGLHRGDYHAENITSKEGKMKFDMIGPDRKYADVEMPMLGLYNVENAIAAMLVAQQMGVDENTIKDALASFQGIRRRFQIVVYEPQLIYIDDYAHHPTEIEKLISSIRFTFPDKKITMIFQPHLYTRTRDLSLDFSKALSKADAILLLDIYPARETPISSVDAEMILKNITCQQKKKCTKKTLIENLQGLDTELLVTAGAGDIDTLVEPIKKWIKNRC